MSETKKELKLDKEKCVIERNTYENGKLVHIEMGRICEVGIEEIQNLQQSNARLREENEESADIVKAVAYIGVDFGYGKYELEDSKIELARNLYEKITGTEPPQGKDG